MRMVNIRYMVFLTAVMDGAILLYCHHTPIQVATMYHYLKHCNIHRLYQQRCALQRLQSRPPAVYLLKSEPMPDSNQWNQPVVETPDWYLADIELPTDYEDEWPITSTTRQVIDYNSIRTVTPPVSKCCWELMFRANSRRSSRSNPLQSLMSV